MKIQDIQGKEIKITKSTITKVDENTGKTQGMITQVKSFYTMVPREHFDLHQSLKKAGADRHAINWKRMFLIDGEWYFLIDKKYVENMHKYAFLDGNEPIERFEKAKKEAEKFGATIIEVARIIDSRKF